MSSRFEKIIATAVLAGALALTGCSSEDAEILPTYNAGTSFNPAPTSPTTGGGGGGPPVLLSARTVGPGKVELTYSEPMAVGDPVAAAANFTLKRNGYAVGATPFATPTPTIGTWFYGYVTSNRVFRSFPPPGPSPTIGINSVTINAVNSARVMLNIAPALVEADDGGTGKLRLSFTNVGNEVTDQAGNPAPNIIEPPTDKTNPLVNRGNVDDRSFSPAIIDARTINATTVELTFNKEITAAGVPATDFILRHNFWFAGSYPFPSSVTYVSFQYLGSAVFGSVGTNIFIYSPLVITPNNLKIILSTSNIPTTADFGTGLLRLYYSSGGTTIDSMNGPPGTILPNITLGSPTPPASVNAQHPGNVIDTL